MMFLAAALVLVTTGSTPPLSYIDETTGEIVGTEIEIAREAAESLGCTLEVRKETFPELLPMVSDGHADMAASGITITDGRRQTVDFTIPYTTEGGMFLYRASEAMPSLGKNIRRFRIGTMDASTYDFYLVAHGVDPVRYDVYGSAVDDLRAGKLDAVFYDSCSVRITAEESGGEFVFSPLETRENFGIAIAKGNSALKEALDNAILRRISVRGTRRHSGKRIKR